MFRRACLVVADGGRARLFVLTPGEHLDVGEVPELEELEDLVNPEVDVSPADRSDDHGTGRRTLFRGGPQHGYQDSWDREEVRLKERFARLIVDETVRVATRGGVSDVVLVAEARMLGLIRHHMDLFAKAHLRCVEHAADFTKIGTLELQRRLAAEGLIPQPARLSAMV